MTLRELKIERKKKGSEPLISISQTGWLRMNKTAIEVINGKDWQRVGLFNDADSPNNWYIGVSNEGVKVSIYRDGSLRGAGGINYFRRLSQQFGIPGIVKLSIHPQPEEIKGNRYYRLIVKK